MPETAPSPREYPRKMFYRINEVSQITGIKPYVLRYWETEFPSLKPGKDSGDQRRYRPDDIDMIFEIKRLLYEEKFTIAGARQHLNDKPGGPPAEVVEVVHQRPRASIRNIKKIRRKVADLRRDLNNLHSFI